MSRLRWAVLLAALLLIVVWGIANTGRLFADEDGLVRLVLGLLFGLLIIGRKKPAEGDSSPGEDSNTTAIAAGLLGAAGAIGGIVFKVHQFEWLGIILLLYACLRWSLPRRFRHDIALALLLVYWLHPLPNQIFGAMQLAMQKWSVAGSEWMLHGFNVRVWADGLFLHSGYMVVGVPEACSGMRTSVTVLLSALGVGILCRYRWWELIVLCAVGIAQVLVLNMIRISVVVSLAPKMAPEWADTVLHDSVGVFLLVSILLIQVEASWWQYLRVRKQTIRDLIRQHIVERPEKATTLPRFWHKLVKWIRPIALGLIVTGLVAAVIYKSRPAHRAVMRREVIEALMVTDPELAEKAITMALEKAPGDATLLGQRAEVFVMQRKFADAVPAFDAVPAELTPYQVTLKSWSMMSLGRVDDAIALIDALPLAQRKLPGVAMVRAEYAALKDDPESARFYIVHAAHSLLDLDRVRALFPFLARHQQWRAIAKSDSNKPYKDPTIARVAVEACLREGRMDQAAESMKHVIHKWPADPRFLRALYQLAANHPGGEWEGRFARSLTKNLDTLNLEDLVTYMEFSFQLNLPDLGWLAYQQLLLIDPEHPDRSYAPAQFGRQWYRFGRRRVGAGGEQDGVIDLRPLRAQTLHLWPLARLWRHVPLDSVLSVRSPDAAIGAYHREALESLLKRESAGTLTRRGEVILPSLLAAEGRFDDAYERLDRLEVRYPSLADAIMLRRAEFYDRQGRWADAYETLRRYHDLTGQSELRADMMMENAMLNVNLGVAAYEVARQVVKRYPDAPQTRLLMAAIWDIFGFKEQARFALGGSIDPLHTVLAARLAEETGRLREAETLNAGLSLPTDHAAVGAHQSLYLMPAEFAVARRWPEAPSAEASAQEAESLAASAADWAASPYLSGLCELTIAWYRHPDATGGVDVAAWRGIARDDVEEGAALHRLAVLLARQGAYDEARRVIDLALEALPASPICHRVRISLSEGDATVVEQARKACPADDEIWLASLVAQVRENVATNAVVDALREAVAAETFPVSAYVRAGDLLLRNGRYEGASVAAHYAVEHADGLVAAYMLGLRCALATDDAAWALSCARKGVEHSLNPAVFYRAIVEVKLAQKEADADLVAALEYLREEYPADHKWSEFLGQVYFEQGDAERALSVLEPTLTGGLGPSGPRPLVLAAEAARQSGQIGKAIRLLRLAHAKFPDHINVLNNLVYDLAQVQDGIPEALKLLPALQKMGSTRPEVLDTIAVVLLRSGHLEEARRMMDDALANMEGRPQTALEMRLNAAEALYRAGQYAAAEEQIQIVRVDDLVTDIVEVRARRLLDAVKRAKTENPPGEKPRQ